MPMPGRKCQDPVPAESQTIHHEVSHNLSTKDKDEWRNALKHREKATPSRRMASLGSETLAPPYYASTALSTHIRDQSRIYHETVCQRTGKKSHLRIIKVRIGGEEWTGRRFPRTVPRHDQFVSFHLVRHNTSQVPLESSGKPVENRHERAHTSQENDTSFHEPGLATVPVDRCGMVAWDHFPVITWEFHVRIQLKSLTCFAKNYS